MLGMLDSAPFERVAEKLALEPDDTRRATLPGAEWFGGKR